MTRCAGRTPRGGPGATPPAGATRAAATCRPPRGTPATPGPTGPAPTVDSGRGSLAHLNAFGQYDWPVGIALKAVFLILTFYTKVSFPSSSKRFLLF